MSDWNIYETIEWHLDSPDAPKPHNDPQLRHELLSTARRVYPALRALALHRLLAVLPVDEQAGVKEEIVSAIEEEPPDEERGMVIHLLAPWSVAEGGEVLRRVVAAAQEVSSSFARRDLLWVLGQIECPRPMDGGANK